MRQIIILALISTLGCFPFHHIDGQTTSKPAFASDKLVVTGHLIDQQSEQPLEFATISIFESGNDQLLDGGLTDGNGDFEVTITRTTVYAIIEYIGYDIKRIDPLFNLSDHVNDSRHSIGTISISQGALDLEGVEIRAEKSESQFSLDKTVFNVGKDLANRGGSAVDILDNVPSVTVDVEGQVSLRGSTGVRILIDGKRSGLGENLRNIPSNQIDRIEVITNPSARYDAEGMAGIINIILKKDTRSGFNGSFDVNFGYPKQAGVGANLNYRKNKINWFAGYGLQFRESPGESTQTTEIYSGDTIRASEQDREFNRENTSHTVRFGLDYFFNAKTTLTAAFRYQDSKQDNFTVNQYQDLNNFALANPISQTRRTDDELEEESELEYSLLLNKEFNSRDHTLKISLDYEDELEKEHSNFIEVIQPNIGVAETLLQRSMNDEGQKEWVVQADYVHPFSKTERMEFGLKGSFRTITNDFLVEELISEDWNPLIGLSNNFIYDENIYAAYSQYGDKYGKFSVQAGLRIEFANIKTELLQTQEVNERDKLDFFSSLFIGYEIAESDAIQVSYSRRIQRPRFWHLNPFFSFNDSRNFFVGNPNLNPEYTDSYELNYLKFWDKATLNAGLFYRYATSVIERLRTIDEEGRTTLRPQNLSDRHDFGISISANYSAIDWLRFDGSTNFFRSITDGTNVGESLESDTYTWDGRLSTRFTFWQKSDLQLSLNYRSPRETTQGERQSMTSLNIGWSKDLLRQKNLTFTFSIRDVFNSRKRRYTQFGESFRTDGEFQWRTRSANIAFNYRVNQKKPRQKQQRNFEGGGEGF